MIKIYNICCKEIFLIFLTICTVLGAENTTTQPTEELVLSFQMPNDGILSDLSVIVQLDSFQQCNDAQCAYLCGTKNRTLGYCNKINTKLCMCTSSMFYTSELEGSVASVDRNNIEHKNCSVACNKRLSYARIWTKPDKTQHCTCLMDQQTPTGITKCDEFAVKNLCKPICQTDTAICTFNGVCLCRKNWESFYKLEMPFTRKSTPEDNNECADQCSSYHHDYIPRIFDMKIHDKSLNKTYKFREKYCLCGDWLDLSTAPQTKAILNQGFQLCTGLKCKRRCGMDEVSD